MANLKEGLELYFKGAARPESLEPVIIATVELPHPDGQRPLIAAKAGRSGRTHTARRIEEILRRRTSRSR